MKTNFHAVFVNGISAGEVYEASGRWWWNQPRMAPHCFEAGATLAKEVTDYIEWSYKVQPGSIHYLKDEED